MFDMGYNFLFPDDQPIVHLQTDILKNDGNYINASLNDVSCYFKHVSPSLIMYHKLLASTYFMQSGKASIEYCNVSNIVKFYKNATCDSI